MMAQFLYSAEFVANKHKGKQMIEKNWMELQKPDQIGVKASEYNPRQAVISAVSYTHLTLPTILLV